MNSRRLRQIEDGTQGHMIGLQCQMLSTDSVQLWRDGVQEGKASYAAVAVARAGNRSAVYLSARQARVLAMRLLDVADELDGGIGSEFIPGDLSAAAKAVE